MLTKENDEGIHGNSIFYHESGKLYAEDVDQHIAVLPEVAFVMGHPLEYTFVYSTFTDDSEGRCPNTSRTRVAEEANQLNTRLVEKKKRTVFYIVKLLNKCKSVVNWS